MIEKLQALTQKEERIVVGIMSGTSVDGIDAVLLKMSGHYTGTKLTEIAFNNYAFPDGIKERVFKLFEGGEASEFCHMNFLLGNLFADAAVDLAKQAGVDKIDLVGSHGQTIYHIPDPLDKDYPMRSTLQIGEGAVIAHKTGAVTVTDFRVADVAAGGLGAPLVPYVDFLLYSEPDCTVALQNIGGIGNITVIPQGAAARDVVAFDTGPGNMVIDYLMQKVFGLGYDKDGAVAAMGKVNDELLARFMVDDYIPKPPPKATGREYYGGAYSEKFYAICKDAGVCDNDIIATATALTAETIMYSVNNFVPHSINKFVVGGGGAYNKTLMAEIKKRLPQMKVMTQEEAGKSSDAKEAIAFAILANEAIFGNPANMPQVTGSDGPKVLGKISV